MTSFTSSDSRKKIIVKPCPKTKKEKVVAYYLSAVVLSFRDYAAAVAALRLVRTPGLCRDWPAADTRDAYGERLRVDYRFLTLEFHWASFCSHGGEWFRAGTDPEMAGSDTVTVAV